MNWFKTAKKKFGTASSSAAIWATALLCALLSSGCLNTTAAPSSKTAKASSGSASSTGSSSSSSACAIFSNNSRDYATCQSCVSALGSGASNASIIECVHTNVRTIGGSCIIPSCGAGQAVDFTSCSCRSTSSSGGGQTQPGYEDQLTPFMRTGFYVGTFYCSPSAGSDKNLCLDEITGFGNIDAQKYSTLSPVNVQQDVGYVRWDLAIDASQYPIENALENGNLFFGTFGTLIGNHSFEYRLKPNTYKSSNTIQWQDCVEHFSGSSTSQVSSNNRCDLHTGSVSVIAPEAASLPVNAITSTSGSALLEKLSMNGTTSNRNLLHNALGTLATEYGNPIALYGYGLSKDNDDDGAPATSETSGPGMFSNLGYYKYSWGPFAVENSSGLALSSNGTITSSTAAVTSLHFLPVSTVESSALAPDSEDGSVESRTCSHASDPCGVTAIYRTSGGAVAIQNFSPKFGSTHSSAVSLLPSGVTAVGTPKLIEDTSQLSTSTSTSANKPARLRAFARSADGNIYMTYTKDRQWQSWVSLGRPWMCSAAAGAGGLDCAAGANATTDSCCIKLINTSPARTYSAFVQDYNSLDELSPNDGISIAGEPVVLSYMDTVSGIATNVVQGYIMILVRVSHLQSSDGTLGRYHNAVFYNYARTINGEISSGATLDFDTMTNWSGWMPVTDGADLFRIQGDPVGTILEDGGGVVRAHIFGTLRDTANSVAAPGGGSPVLHPPIGPDSAGNDAVNPTGQPWHNYGNVIIRTFRTISAAVPASSVENDEANAASWNNIQGDTRTPAAGVTIVGNLSLFTRSSTSIEVLANQISAVTTSDGNNTAPQSFSKQIGIYYYDDTGAQAATGGANGVVTEDTTFIGSPQLAYVGSNTNSHDDGLDGVSLGGINANDRFFVVGRALCPEATIGGQPTYPCDRASPSFAFMRFDEDGGTDNLAVIYYNGVNFEINNLARNFSQSNIRTGAITATSDVVPIYSSSLDNDGADVPVYLFVRDVTGRLAVGRFLRYNDGISGAQIWQFVVTGGYVN